MFFPVLLIFIIQLVFPPLSPFCFFNAYPMINVSSHPLFVCFYLNPTYNFPSIIRLSNILPQPFTSLNPALLVQITPFLSNDYGNHLPVCVLPLLLWFVSPPPFPTWITTRSCQVDMFKSDAHFVFNSKGSTRLALKNGFLFFSHPFMCEEWFLFFHILLSLSGFGFLYISLLL